MFLGQNKNIGYFERRKVETGQIKARRVVLTSSSSRRATNSDQQKARGRDGGDAVRAGIRVRVWTSGCGALPSAHPGGNDGAWLATAGRVATRARSDADGRAQMRAKEVRPRAQREGVHVCAVRMFVYVDREDT